MFHTKMILRAGAVSTLALSLLFLVLWSTGNYPPIALANGGGGGTMRTLTKCSPITGGTITNSPAGNTFANNTVVTLTATPNAGYEFAGWSGAVSGMTNPVQLTMNANKNVCATFNKIQRTLTVQIDGDCGGSVSPSVGTHQYDHGSTVTVTASPSMYFDHWSGSGVPSGQEMSSSISVLMDANKTVKAHYKPATLTMAVSGGAGATTSPSVGNHTFCQGEYVEISASPSEGFSHWVGDATVPTNRTTTVYMDGPTKSVTAVFDTVTLTMDKSGGVSGASVSPSEGAHTYTKGATVNLSASPSDFFIEWMGDFASESASDSFKILENTAVTGVFAAKYLTVTVEGDTGTTDPEPDIPHPYATGDDATISVDPADAFDHWEGDIPLGDDSTHPLTVTMDADKTITAVLKPEYTLTMAKGDENCEECTISPEAGDHPYLAGDEAEISASPADRFAYWEGDVPEGNLYDASTTIAMDASKIVTAHFKPKYTLTTAVAAGACEDCAVSPETGTTYIAGEIANVTATPTERFDYWEGDVDPEDIHDDSIGIIMDANKSVTAHFKPDVTLTLVKQGVGALNPEEGVHTYIRDETESVVASPANGFDHWEGDLEENDDPNNPMQVVELTQSKSLTAVFKPMYTLTMAREGDGGTVTPGVGTHDYREGETAQLLAVGNDTWIFTGWSGDASGAFPSVNLPMNANKSVTANFIAGVKITVGKQGQGTVSPGTGVYPMGGTKTFTATPASGWRWSHWEGNLGGADGNDASLDLPMNQARSITAVFVEQVTLTMVKELIGNLPAEGNKVSPAEGETLHDKDSVVDLVATPDGGWRFKEWSGDKSGTNPTTTITMSGDKTVTANFIQVHIVTTEVIEQGVIEPEGGTYDHGESESFFFDRQSGHQFHHWAGLPDSHSTPAWGPGTSTTNPVNVTIEESLHLVGYDDEIIYTLTADVDADGCTGCAVDPPVAEYIEGTPGTVTATPGEGWGFVRWEGNVPAEMVEDNPLVMPMNSDKAVTAVFVPSAYTLAIAVNTDVGDVTSPEAGSYSYSAGETYQVSTEQQVGNYVFEKWELLYSNPGWTRYVEGNPGSFEMAESDVTLKALYARKTCSELLDGGEGTSISVEFPNWDFLKNACETAAKAAPMISDISIAANGSASISTETVCCDPDSTSELPSASYSMTGSVEAGISVTMNVPGWSWYVGGGYQQPIPFHVVFQADLGPSVTVSPSGSLDVEGGTADCGGPCGVVVSLTGGVGLAVGFGGKVDALVEVFEDGHWYSIDGGVQFELSASASSEVVLTGELNISSEEIGQGCGAGGASVTGVSVGYGDVVGTGQAVATVAGYGLSIQHTWTLLEGYSYPE